MSEETLVRTLRTAVRVPGAEAPFDTAAITLRHPALPAHDQAARMSGMLAPDPSRAPYPVVVVLPGINVASAGYLDLAVALVRSGMVALTFDWVGQLFPGQYGLTPGVDLAAVTPQAYGSAPTTPALAPVLDALARCQAAGPLAGLLDLDRVGLFGHSAGGTVALQSAHPDWFPNIRSVATYGAHTMASEQLGFAPDTLLDSPATVPTLVVAGDRDGVVAASAVRYGRDPHDPTHDPVVRTHEHALGRSPDAHLVRIGGAGHMLPAAPEDPTSARGFLEEPLPDQDRLRSLLLDLVAAWFADTLAVPTTDAGLPTSSRFTELLHHPDIVDVRRRQEGP